MQKERLEMSQILIKIIGKISKVGMSKASETSIRAENVTNLKNVNDLRNVKNFENVNY